MVGGDELAARVLEEERALLHAGVHLAVDEDAGGEVPLGAGAELLVLGHDAPVHGGDDLEVGVGGGLVAVDLVAHGGVGWAAGDEALYEEEVWAKVEGGGLSAGKWVVVK